MAYLRIGPAVERHRRWSLPAAALLVVVLGGASGPAWAREDLAAAGDAARQSAFQRALGVHPLGALFGPQTAAPAAGARSRTRAAPDLRRGLRVRRRANGGAAALSSPAGGASAGGRRPSRGQAAILERIAECETGGDPRAVSADGRYRGKYQFDRPTWRRLGGRGDPARAPEAEQDRRAAQLLAQSGTSAWPNCAG